MEQIACSQLEPQALPFEMFLENPKDQQLDPPDRVTLGQAYEDSGLMAPKALRQAVAGPQSAQSPSSLLATGYAQAGGSREKLESISDEAWNRAQSLVGYLQPEYQGQISQSHHSILAVATRNGAERNLSGVYPAKAEAIQATFPGDAALQKQAFQAVVAAQKDEHSYMSQMLAIRHFGQKNGHSEMASFADTYLKSRHDMNQIRGFVTQLSPEVQLGW